jgi:protein-S-isoprenylcysteine O-methyltransferase Ste14
VRFPPPLVLVFGTVMGAALHHFVWQLHAPLPSCLRIGIGIGLVVASVAIIASTLVLFKRTGQDPKPWKPTPSLIVRGPYRFSRNPIYLGLVLASFGLGIAIDELWVSAFALFALVVVHLVAVVPEERYLAEVFGEEYARYRDRVRRYL